ncbi:NADH dehydrogenase [ubiquinone] 1 alpha subcomplex subunit 9, mitochondrial [Aplysia californica]|uniref:NADH dehydrogenase [ubiquinone] 1 alpha subcomplex subunit 9, mitochondrial n=1 Tax=Aplysia californica TaxID=6500 RepID=A0ABM0JMC7_APLCA|nr:NADH dehydrogenase [ubiquinone] 1 alpha subcomplex subunit 9, mitochondrial [Aplysia californica]
MSVVLAKAAGGSFGRQSWSQLPRVAGCVIVQHRDASNTVPSQLSALKRGTGGRSSFSGIVATVFGASGFLGRYVCNRLGKIGSQVIVPYRCDAYDIERLRMTGDLGQVLFFPFHLKDEDSIRKTVQYSNVVINLIGREFETKNFTYNDVHVKGARRLARIAKECGVERFIHMSHLNAKADPQKIWTSSDYLKSKYEGELAVREEFPEAIIFKPADMFGSEDQFLNYYNYRSRWSVVPQGIPLWKKGEQTIKQPVYVADVAEGIIQSIRNSGMEGKDIECVGPQRYYLADIVDYIIRVLRREDTLKRTDRTLMLRVKAMLLDRVATKSWYNADKLEREAITDWTTPGNPTLEDLGVDLKQFDAMARFLLFPMRRNAYYAEKLGEFAEPEPPLPAEHYISKHTAATS